MTAIRPCPIVTRSAGTRWCQHGNGPPGSASLLDLVAGLEEPPDDAEADREEYRDHYDAHGDADVGDLVEAPAEARDQIDDRVDETHRLPERRQHIDRIEAAAQERQRRKHEQRNDLQL